MNVINLENDIMDDLLYLCSHDFKVMKFCDKIINFKD